jgi:outer membrane immunogenic protein
MPAFRRLLAPSIASLKAGGYQLRACGSDTRSIAFLPYVTGGVSIGNVTQDIVGQPFGVAESVSFNWTAGAGLEFVVSGPLTAKLEYLYVNHINTACNVECNGVISGGAIHMGLNENIFRVGLNYKLWSQ